MANNIKPLTLHAHGSGPNPYKVAILLEALSIPYHVKLWEFGDTPNGVKGPRFTKINENGRVPAIEDPNTGIVAWKSAACINYILRTYDTSHKYGPGPSASEQAHVDFDKWTSFLLSTLGPMQGQVNWFKHYNAEKNDDALKRYTEQTYRCYMVLEGQVKKTGGKSILEGGFSAVDAHFYPWVVSHGYGGLELSKYPNVQKWLSAMGERPEVKAAYEKVSKGEKA
ncbi:Thioredoxin-like fold [Lasallia pustulata]|uniref:Thioredoxin-like fold n=1 Tax=Lasallia pustulata TaxID=136370 RepID=A0A1W5DB23_9LECA|nr:Thioredoxin-like fold [Lasallia pustulata]